MRHQHSDKVSNCVIIDLFHLHRKISWGSEVETAHSGMPLLHYSLLYISNIRSWPTVKTAAISSNVLATYHRLVLDLLNEAYQQLAIQCSEKKQSQCNLQNKWSKLQTEKTATKQILANTLNRSTSTNAERNIEFRRFLKREKRKEKKS